MPPARWSDWNEKQQHSATSWYIKFPAGWSEPAISRSTRRRFLRFFDRVQLFLVRHGFYHLPGDYFGDPFDMEMSAWTYRKVVETGPFPVGFAPLGVEGGIAKEKHKMDQLYGRPGRSATFPSASWCIRGPRS